MPREAVGKLKDAVVESSGKSSGKGRGKKERMTKEEMDEVLQEVYVKEKDGGRTLLVPYLDRVEKVSARDASFQSRDMSFLCAIHLPYISMY